MVPETRLRPVCRSHPTMWSLDFRLMTSNKWHVGAGRDPGGVAAAMDDVADACSVGIGLFCCRLLSSFTVHGSVGSRGLDAVTTATLAFNRASSSFFFFFFFC
ncbi:unnamed protein product [Ixodes pacificus]